MGRTKKKVLIAIKNQINNHYKEIFNIIRTQNNMTQKELANFLNINQSTISRYENGDTEISVVMLKLLMNRCDFSETYYWKNHSEKYIYHQALQNLYVSISQTDDDTEILRLLDEFPYQFVVSSTKSYTFWLTQTKEFIAKMIDEEGNLTTGAMITALFLGLLMCFILKVFGLF